MLEIRSPAFARGEAIPTKYTCEGGDISPPLAWSGAPEGTKSFALLVDDPDAPDPAAPKRVWLHWIRYNIAPDIQELAEGAGNDSPTQGAQDLRNDDKVAGWSGPCPPRGRHRYFFHLYALDTILAGLSDGARRKEFEQAVEGHVLGMAETMGTYEKAGRREGEGGERAGGAKPWLCPSCAWNEYDPTGRRPKLDAGRETRITRRAPEFRVRRTATPRITVSPTTALDGADWGHGSGRTPAVRWPFAV